VWILPVVLAALVLSLPAQVKFASLVAEPYPGLFQPAFNGNSQRDSDQTVKFTTVELAVDGHRIEPSDLIPEDDERAEVLTTAFPLGGGDVKVDDATRQSMRSALARRFGTDPGELTVRWEHRRFHLDTGKITQGKTLATYRVDLRGDNP
jgi:hypothetical protein